MLGSLSTSGVQPYWAATDRWGLMPEGNGALAVLKATAQSDTSKAWQWGIGTSLAGNADGMNPGFHPMVDELYARVSWKVLSLDLGMKHHSFDFAASGNLGSLSTTGGSVVWCGNARTMPGYTITLSPWEVVKKHLWLEAAFGDYKTMDNRYVSNALVHNTRLGITVGFAERFRFGISLDHYAMWGGHSPEFGDMPASFSNYVKMLFGQPGKGGWAGDQVNVLGNHLGGEKFRFDYLGNGWKVTFQHDIPYDDTSGMLFHNFPDGVNTLCFAFDDKDRWVSDILYEFTYTKCQSGAKHDEKADDGSTKILGGNDNYFNNVYYKSGWTYYGRIIGLPLFVPAGKNDEGITLGVSSNRITAHHVAVSGKLFKVAPYRLMLTFSSQWGTYKDPFDGAPLNQFSMGFDGEMPFSWGKRQMITLKYGLYVDAGQILKDSFGASIGLCFKIY